MRIFQIYFKEEQKELLEEGCVPIFNEDCTVFFESQVIRDLCESGAFIGADYVGVISYSLRKKLGTMKTEWANHPNIANNSVQEFSMQIYREELYKHRPDIFSFQRHGGHDPITLGETFHKGFIKYWNHILGEIGFNWTPQYYNDIFYCNFFTARGDIYQDFVEGLLAPAMDVMKQMPELMGNSGYPKPLPNDLKTKWGINHYPYHSFLCERLMSFYCHNYKLKALHY